MKLKKLSIILFSLSFFALFFTKAQVVEASDTAEQAYKTVIDTRDSVVSLYAKGDDNVFKKVTNRALAPTSSWYTDKQVYHGLTENNTYGNFFRVATNEWAEYKDSNFGVEVILQKLTAQVDNYPQINAQTITVKDGVKAPIYDSYGHRTGKTVPANSSWSTDRLYSYGSGIPLDFIAYRIGSNQWLSYDDVNITATR